MLLVVAALFVFGQLVVGQDLHNLQRDINVPSDVQRRGYSLDAANLDLLYRRTALMALLKAKARQELQLMPTTERIVYEQCEHGAKTPVELAKCVRRLLRERDRRRGHQPTMSDKSTENWMQDTFRVPPSETLFPDQPVVPAHRPTPVFPRPHDPHRSRQVNKHRLRIKYRHAQMLKYNHTKSTDAKVNDEEKFSGKFRRRRAINSRPPVRKQPTSPRCRTPGNVVNLRRVQHYFELGNYCMKYLKSVGEVNTKFLDQFRMPVTFKNHQMDRAAPAEQLRSIVEQLDNEGFSFMSPKILNIVPQKHSDKRAQLLSPTLFSFHDEGLLPLPKLLKLSGSNECEMQEWIDLLMDISGASHKLDALLSKFETHVKHVTTELFPKIQELERQDRLWKQVENSMSLDQQRAMQRFGYTRMSADQLKTVYGDSGLHPTLPIIDELYRDTVRGRNTDDQLIERIVAEMSELNGLKPLNASTAFRTKRDAEAAAAESPGLAAPYALSNQVGMPSFLGNLILSPHAFINELFNPRFLGSDIISPRAFVATTLSPFAMVARVLAPAAFRVQTLSPQALTAIILTPEAFIAAILSPRALEVRVLSPEVITVGVLSPSAGVVRVLSPADVSCFVLSPNILGANFLSHVLSPSVLVADDNIG